MEKKRFWEATTPRFSENCSWLKSADNILRVVTTLKVDLNAGRVALASANMTNSAVSLHVCLLFWFCSEFRFCSYSWWVATCLKELCRKTNFFTHLGCFWWWNLGCWASPGQGDSWRSGPGSGRLDPLRWQSGSPVLNGGRRISGGSLFLRRTCCITAGEIWWQFILGFWDYYHCAPVNECGTLLDLWLFNSIS